MATDRAKRKNDALLKNRGSEYGGRSIAQASTLEGAQFPSDWGYVRLFVSPGDYA